MGSIRFVERPVAVIGGGNLTHGASFTVTGSGFGSKATAAPIIWDNCTTGTFPVDAGWSGSYPDVGDTNDYLKYRTTVRGVAMPHSNITKYLAGAHSTDFYVSFWKTRSMSGGYPKFTYLSYYHRADPLWTFGEDNNYKTYCFSTGVLQNAATNWYSAFIVHPDSNTDAPANIQWLLNDDGYGDTPPHISLDDTKYFWGQGQNPMAGWLKNEWEIRWSNASDGYIKMWENGVLIINYSGATDAYPGTDRSEAIGGYARRYPHADNWRYWADIYYDQTLSRLVLANNATIENATIVEPQPVTIWSDGSITATCNKGALAAGPVYPHVRTSSSTWVSRPSMTMN